MKTKLNINQTSNYDRPRTLAQITEAENLIRSAQKRKKAKNSDMRGMNLDCPDRKCTYSDCSGRTFLANVT